MLGLWPVLVCFPSFQVGKQAVGLMGCLLVFDVSGYGSYPLFGHAKCSVGPLPFEEFAWAYFVCHQVGGGAFGLPDKKRYRKRGREAHKQMHMVGYAADSQGLAF